MACAYAKCIHQIVSEHKNLHCNGNHPAYSRETCSHSVCRYCCHFFDSWHIVLACFIWGPVDDLDGSCRLSLIIAESEYAAGKSWARKKSHPGKACRCTLISSRRKNDRYGQSEVGHVHFWGDVDILYPHPIRDFLLEQNLAERHRWVPYSGWTTFRIRGGEDVQHAIWLMRLSYLRYALKSATGRLLETEGHRHSLGPALVSMLSRFIPPNTTTAKVSGTASTVSLKERSP
jgi:hypothetical protein